MSSVETPSENDEFSECSRADLCQRIRDLEAENASLREENTTLKQFVATYGQWIHNLKSRLNRYENPNTPPSKQGGAAWLSFEEFLDEETDDDHTDTDETDSDDGDSAAGDHESDEEGGDPDDAGGDSDAASDSSPGRKPGHEGTTRPPPDPDRTIWVDEAQCANCGRVFSNPDRYLTQTVIDTPLPIPVEVIEYKLGKQECTCGNEAVAEHPDCPEKGRFGPNVLAQTALLRYQGRLPNRKVADLFEWQFDQSVSHGTIYNLTKRVAAQLRPAYEDVKEKIRESDIVYVDETGWPVDGDQYWLWTFVTDEEVLHVIADNRGSKVLEEVLGDAFAEDATLGCDGWPAYPAFHSKLQRCWSHLLREARFVAARYEEAEPGSEELHDLYDELTAFDEKDPSASAREQKRAEATLRLQAVINEEYVVERVQQLITTIKNGMGSWLTFVTEPDVKPTNNRAERAIRNQVVMRKVFGGLRSEEGTWIHETITTMLATWQQRGLDPPEQLTSILGGERPEATSASEHGETHH